MSWQLGAFALLGLALAAGFAWYERQRPDARIVALVGTLAAFAALGRIAFAARAERQADDRHRADLRVRAGRRPGLRGRSSGGLDVELLLRAGAVDAVADGRLGGDRRCSARPWPADPRAAPGRRRLDRPLAAGHRLRHRRFAFTVIQDVGDWVTYSATAWRSWGVRRPGAGLRRDPCRRLRRLRARLGSGPDALDPALCPPAAGDLVRRPVRRAGDRRRLGAVRRAVGRDRRASPGRRAQWRGSAPARGGRTDGGFGPAPGQPSAELYSGWAALGLASAAD